MMKKGFIALFSMLGLDTTELEASAEKAMATEEQLAAATKKAEEMKTANDSAAAALEKAKADHTTAIEKLKADHEAALKAATEAKEKAEGELAATKTKLEKMVAVHGDIDPTNPGAKEGEDGDGVPAYVDMNASHNQYFKSLGIL